MSEMQEWGAYKASPTGADFFVGQEPGGAAFHSELENLPGSSGGGSGGGSVREITFDFAYDDAGLNDGIEAYVPTVGDTLLDAWVEITEAWDGTTPLGDVGPFLASTNGYFGTFTNGPFRTDLIDVETQALQSQNFSAVAPSGLGSAILLSASGSPPYRLLPMSFTTTDPIKVCVSQDGTAGGTAPGASQGAATLHLLVSTPNATDDSSAVRVVVEETFDFTYATADLLTGAAAYTPAIGEVLVDAWFEITEAWDGTTPYGDLGLFTSSTFGWVGWIVGGANPTIDMTQADSDAVSGGPGGVRMNPATPSLSQLNAGATVNGGLWRIPAIPAVPVGEQYFESSGFGASSSERMVPCEFVSTSPLRVVVSQDGRNDGDDPGSTQGAATLHMLISRELAVSVSGATRTAVFNGDVADVYFGSTRLEVVGAPGAGKAIDFLDLSLEYQPGSTFVSASAGSPPNSALAFGDSDEWMASIPNFAPIVNALTAAAFVARFVPCWLGSGTAVDLANAENAAMKIKPDGSPHPLQGPLESIVVNDGGSGYAIGDTLTDYNWNYGDIVIEVDAVDGGGAVTAAHLTDPGDYTVWKADSAVTTEGVAPQPGVGTGFTFDAVPDDTVEGTVRITVHYRIVDLSA